MAETLQSPAQIDSAQLKEWFSGCYDVVMQEKKFLDGGKPSTATILYCSSVCDQKQLQQVVLPYIQRILTRCSEVSAPSPAGQQDPLLKSNELEIDSNQNFLFQPLMNADKVTLAEKVFDGDLMFLWRRRLYTVDLADKPQRQPSESKTEVSILGPRDAFVESLSINYGLIRKRVRSTDLQIEQFLLGTQSRTKVGLLYMDGIIQEDLVQRVRDRIQAIDVDTIHSHAQIRELISDSKLPVFPVMYTTTRPDFVVECLMNGRFVIMTDNMPIAIVAPINLWFLLKSAEDAHYPFAFVSFERIIRFAGLVLSLYFPGFWVAMASFHQDQIPFSLLATLVVSRQGVPLPLALELLIMMGLFELFREAGMRLPPVVGQTLAVVGGLIIGDAAIRAGLTSPAMLVVAALSAVASFTLTSQTLVGTVSIIRVLVIIASSFLGIFGFLIGVFTVTVYLSSLRSMGIAYMGPISPIRFKDLLDTLFRQPWSQRKKRPDLIHAKQGK